MFLLQPLNSAPLPSELLSLLSSQEFQQREAAEAKLLEWCKTKPGLAKNELFRQSQSAVDPETRARCLEVLRSLVFEDYAKEGEGYIGINLEDDKSPVPGDEKLRSVIRVKLTMPDTAAAKVGIQVNDLIVSLDEQRWYDVKASEHFMKKIRSMKPKEQVKLKILRGDKLMDFSVTLGRRPVIADMQMQWPQGNSADRQAAEMAAERAAKEAYFKRWLSEKRMQK